VKKVILKNSAVKKTSKATENLKSPKSAFFIVGIGASAGGLEALKVFFKNTPSNSGMAFIVVQHLDPTRKSLLTELIAEHTKMKTLEITNGLKIQPNCIYIIPSNKDLSIFHESLKLTEPKEPQIKKRSIDSFFQSLAKQYKEKAIGIVLSGTGNDGTQGLKDIKAEGGLTIVQEPLTAAYSGMPQSAIKAKLADYILVPEKMPLQLNNIKKNIKKQVSLTPTKSTIPSESQLKKIYLLIRNHTGYDFSNYKTNTITRRIHKRTSLNQIEDIEDYITFLQNNQTEIEKLYKDFLIGVTTFFRDTQVFNSVEKNAIPFLIKNCNEKKEIRVWVCGCSTGEEAYSLAILFKEALDKNKQFFQIKKEIREMIVFAYHNVISDPPFSKMDMITCRNLLIYMNSDLQKKIIPIFHYSLNNEGILLLGTSESIGESSNYFNAFDPKIKFYKKKNESTVIKNNSAYELPYTQPKQIHTTDKMNSLIKKKLNVSALTDKILIDNYAPPSVIIDKDNNALYFSGNTGLYLEPPSGEASLNILEMAKKGLKIDLAVSIKKARANKIEVEKTNVDVKVNDHYQTINLIIKPVLTKETDLGAMMVIFEKSDVVIKSNTKKTVKQSGNKITNISELEKELKITREHLQTAINELENSNEDLQTTNEEYQSTNEELQSSNEELETSREELQSVNEELITVNTELSNKIEQLSETNDDLNNLLSSIELATVFLDRNLNVKRFTPAATKIFNLIPTDIDRPVTHLSSNINYKALADDVKNTLKTLAVKSVDVEAHDNTWYHMRILPYRTAENIIEGVLVTFVDITEQKHIAEKLKKTNEHLNIIIENLTAVPYNCSVDAEMKITFVDKSCEKITGYTPEHFTKKKSFWFSRVHPDDKKKIQAAFTNIVKKRSLNFVFNWKCADGKYKPFINYIKYVAPQNNQLGYIVGIWQEIKENGKLVK
jgi:two-component system CheB/CheR fusion protein